MGADVGTVLSTASNVVSDPYFDEMLCRINQLSAVRRGNPIPNCANTPAGTVSGVALDKVTMALRAYAYAEENKWVYPVAIAGILGLPFLLGYYLGKD